MTENRSQPPQVGDVALVSVDSIGYHGRIMTSDQGRMRLYPGDLIVGVFGNRYATDAYEATVAGTENLHLLTGAGMFGTVASRHQSMKAPSTVSLVGYLADRDGRRINLKQRQFRPAAAHPGIDNVVLMVGTGMNSGKTTTATRLVKSLLRRGSRVAACKVTGSVSHNDLHELKSTTPHDVRDFSDYGFPSTYQCQRGELLALFETMLADAARVDPDVIVMEIADGILQRETQLLLSDPAVRRRVRGVVHTAGCASSALFGAAEIERHGHSIAAVSGLITSSPLFMREFSERSTLPIASSTGNGDELAELVLRHCQISQ